MQAGKKRKEKKLQGEVRGMPEDGTSSISEGGMSGIPQDGVIVFSLGGACSSQKKKKKKAAVVLGDVPSCLSPVPPTPDSI